MEIKQVKISDLKPYDKNNKNHPKSQIDLLVKSIKEFWFTNPILLSEDNSIIWWHWRLEAIKQLWWNEAPCVYIKDLTDKQIRKLRLLDNKLAELSEDNIENIKFELEELQDMELNELYDLWLTTDEEAKREEIEDNIPEIDENNIIVQQWDIFKLWNHYLQCWDSMNEEDIKKLLHYSNKEIKTHCISDPPYWIAYNPDKHWMIANDDKILDYTELAKKYTNWFFAMWTWYQVVDIWKQIIEKTYWKVNNMIIWHKWWWWMWDCARSLAQDFEILLVNNRWNFIQWYRWGTTWYWNQPNKNDFLLKAKKEELKDILEEITKWQSLWKVGKDYTNTYLHPTQKPIEINDKVLEHFTARWEQVLDLFWWSGSNLLSCEKNWRVCFMNELDTKYIQVILKRYYDYTEGKKEIKCLNRDLDLQTIFTN